MPSKGDRLDHRHDPVGTRIFVSLLIAGIANFGANLPIFYGARFALPMLPSYAVGIVGLASIAAFRPVLKFGRRWLVSLVGLVIIAASIHWVQSERDERSYQPREILDLKRRMEAQGIHLEPGAVAVRKPHACYWLGLDPGMLPDGQSVEAIVAELARRDIRYLYVGSSEMVLRRVLANLATPRRGSSPPPGLRLLGVGSHRLSPERNIPGALYEVIGVTERPSVELEPYHAPPPAPPGVPHLSYLRARLGRLLLVCGYTSRAKPLLAAAADQEPHWAEAQEWAGDALLFSGDINGASASYRAALESEVRTVSSRTRLAAALLQQDDAAGARTLCREALEISSQASMAALGQSLCEQEEFGAAIAPLILARTDDSSDYESSLTLGWIRRFVQRDSLAARTDYLIALEQLPAGPERASVVKWLGLAEE